MIDYLAMVREFHEKYGHTTATEISERFPTHPTDLVKLRERLITEEAEEHKLASYATYDASDQITLDIVEIADALADLLYVIFGTILAYGIPIEEVFTEVHRSNMTKSMEKDEKSIKGKTIKGPHWEPPRLKQFFR